MGVWSAYRALNEEQRRVLKTKQLSLNRNVEGVIALLQPIAAYDRVGDQARRRFGCTAGIALAVTIALIFFSVNAPAVQIPAVVAALLTILAGYAWIWSRGLDLSNNLRQFMLPVLSVFREDIDPSQRVNVKLDLRPPTTKEKLQRKSDPYAMGSYYKVVDRFYVDPWASAEMPLADGSMLRWSIVDHIREQVKTKRNPRGKIKSKTKYTVKTAMDVELALRSDAYSVEVSDADRVKAGEKKKAIRVKGRHKRETLDGLDPKVFIDMVAGIYRRATPAK